MRGQKKATPTLQRQKKSHTQKTQVIIDQKTQTIIATAFANGSQHDFDLFKKSCRLFSKQIRILADSEYIGLSKLHVNSQIPAKKSKLHPLTKEQMTSNRQISHERIFGRKHHPQVEDLPYFE